jgi:hypothetical protein
MKTSARFSAFAPALGAALGAALSVIPAPRASAAPDAGWLIHDRTRPQPAVVDAGSFSTQEKPGKPPSDAVVLFDGGDISKWVALDGTPTKWVVKDGAMECVPGSGYVRTLQCFGDCQLHVEWATPTPPHGEGQGRGNSGVFFGFDRYEIQVLDSYENKTYADGSAGAVYCQYPPLVNASRRPGEWQFYDIIWTAPRFDNDGKLLSPARVTALHNGVLIHLNVELSGPTGWLTREPYTVHPEKLPIALQDHGNPVRFRNIWVRQLKKGKAEYMLPNELLDSYAGDYEREGGEIAQVRRADDGLLSLSFNDAEFLLYAESPTKFFAKTTDVQCEFKVTDTDKKIVFSVGEPGMTAKKVK